MYIYIYIRKALKTVLIFALTFLSWISLTVCLSAMLHMLVWPCSIWKNRDKRQTSALKPLKNLFIYLPRALSWAFHLPCLLSNGFKYKTIHLSVGFLLGLCFKWKFKKDGGDVWDQEGRFLSESYQLGSNYHFCCSSWFKRCVVHWFFSFTCKRFNQCFVSQVIYVLFLQGIWLMLFLDMIQLLNML